MKVTVQSLPVILALFQIRTNATLITEDVSKSVGIPREGTLVDVGRATVSTLRTTLRARMWMNVW